MKSFSDIYVANVLSPIFQEAKTLFFEFLLDVHHAHLRMLQRVGMIGREEARALCGGLDRISADRICSVNFDGSFEDLFFCVERLLEEECGKETAGSLHLARSRNDIAVTLYRLCWRQEVVQIIEDTLALRATLLQICEREVETLFPLHTHTQPAQPSTIAHYFLGFAEHLERDHQRLWAALRTMNRCPLGACAATGTGFKIDRQVVSDLLAFDGPTGNTYSSIAAVDYFLESVGVVMVLLTALGRLIQDLLLWSTVEFGFVRLEDGYVQSSSIMPQKRNPVALEHARAIASRGFGQAVAAFQMLHNTPYGDIVDEEDDLQPVLSHLFQDCRRCLRLLNGVLSSAEFDRKRLAQRARDHWITMTELADSLVRKEKIPFRTSHEIVASMIRLLDENPGLALSEALRRVSGEILGTGFEYSETQLQEILSPHAFVESRKTPGGPAKDEVWRAIGEAGATLRKDESSVAEFRHRLERYRGNLRQVDGS